MVSWTTHLAVSTEDENAPSILSKVVWKLNCIWKLISRGRGLFGVSKRTFNGFPVVRAWSQCPLSGGLIHSWLCQTGCWMCGQRTSHGRHLSVVGNDFSIQIALQAVGIANKSKIITRIGRGYPGYYKNNMVSTCTNFLKYPDDRWCWHNVNTPKVKIVWGHDLQWHWRSYCIWC